MATYRRNAAAGLSEIAARSNKFTSCCSSRDGAVKASAMKDATARA
jgi:hypothetical protein